MKLESILASLNLDRLYEIGRIYGFMLHDYYSRTLPSTRLVGQMTQPDVAFYAWEHFDANTRKLLKFLCENDGVVTMQAAREYTGFDNSSLSASIHIGSTSCRGRRATIKLRRHLDSASAPAIRPPTPVPTEGG